MNRPIVYTAEIVRAEDFAWGFRDSLEGLANAIADVLGQNSSAMFTGLVASATSPLSLNVVLGPGNGYQLLTVDPTQIGPLPPSTDTAYIQGSNPSQTTLNISTAGMVSGQSMWALIEAQVQFVDVIRTGDPSGGVLQFFNPANPSQPLQGQNGSGGTLPTERTAVIALQVKYGTPATTGTEAPPNADSGWTGLYLIDLAFGQTQILQSQIKVAGPSVGTGVPGNYPAAPLLAGLVNSHHGGVPGQAPQIKLTSEVQGILPLANLPSSNTLGTLPTLRLGTGSPSGTQAGNVDDLWFDTTGNNLYVCKATGSAATAVWSVAVTVAGATPTGAAGGDLSGSYPNPTVAKVNGTSVPSGPTSGQLLVATGASSAAWQAPSTAIAGALIGLPGAQQLVGGNNATSPTTKFDISFLQAILQVPGPGSLIFVGSAALSCTVVGSQTGSVANGRDQTSSFAANTFFHLYAIGGGGQPAALLASLSFFAPTLPTSYTAFAYLATLRTDASGNVAQMFLRGRKVFYRTFQQILTAGTATAPTPVAYGAFVPSQAQELMLGVDMHSVVSTGGGLEVQAFLSLDGTSNIFDQINHWAQTSGQGINFLTSYKSDLPVISPGQFWIWSGAYSGITISMDAWVTGYIVPNGSN